MVRIEDIIERVASYNPSADTEVIKRAYVFSGMVHQGQTRLSGEPYLTHPLEVAEILTDLKMDSSVVATGLLHDTVEDTHTTLEKIEESFGAEIAGLVDGLTKISRVTFARKEDHEAENFRKMILAMAKDIRVVLIKLADRLHNMRTLEALPPEKRVAISRETLDIYAPLANRLGIGWMKAALEDLAFKHLEPEIYAALSEKAETWERESEDYLSEVCALIEKKLSTQRIHGDVSGRIKHLSSIHKKMVEQDLDFEDVADILAFRVVVSTLKQCYGALGVIHSTWKPVPGRFKDYIAIPKSNLYQSLHTTVIGPYGRPMEVQIRTGQMHSVSEFGIASHWKYKEGKTLDAKDDQRFAWLRQLLEWQRDLKDSGEFLEAIKVDLFPEEVFVFTPKGDVKVLPVNSTPVDFAYSIHTDVGHRCTGAKVNGRIVPLRHRLRNGNSVEILTSKSHLPNKDWLQFVVTARARARIRQFIKSEDREKSVALGKEICEKEFRKQGLDLKKLIKSGELDKAAKEVFGLRGVESLYQNIGYGKIGIKQVLTKLLPPEMLVEGSKHKGSNLKKTIQRLSAPAAASGGGIVIKGVEDMLVRFAKCCNPLLGDEIAGFITHGQGVSIHTTSCKNLHNIDRERRIDVEWDRMSRIKTKVKIDVVCKNEKGLLAEMSNAIKNSDANIASAFIRAVSDDRSICTFEVEVMDLSQLNGIIRALGKIKKVVKVERVKSEEEGSDKDPKRASR